MHRYVAFLRGMNLGNRRIKNDELRRHFEGMVAAIAALLGSETRRTMGTNEQIGAKYN